MPETAQFTRYNDHSIAFDYPSGARVVNFDAPGGIALKIVWQVEDALIEIEINGNLSITKSAQERAATFFAAHDIRFNETDNVPPFPITLGEYPALRSRRRFVDGAGAPLIFDYAFVDTRSCATTLNLPPPPKNMKPTSGVLIACWPPSPMRPRALADLWV